jgi:Aerobic-type carbon monoxide dehydrogenase, large subunit CoxL/CutL homologs
MLFYPEEVVLPWVAMRLERPVKWIEDRREHFFATTQERGQTHDAEMALDKDGASSASRTSSCTIPGRTTHTG